MRSGGGRLLASLAKSPPEPPTQGIEHSPNPLSDPKRNNP